MNRQRLGTDQRFDANQVDAGVAKQPRDVQRRRFAIDLGWRRNLREAPVHEHGDAVADRHRLLVVLRDIKRGCAGSLDKRRQLEPHLVTQLGVDVAQRIVEQENRGVRDQRARQGRALLLAVREFPRLMSEDVADLQERGNLLDLLFYDVLRRAARRQRARDVVERRHVRKEREVLKRHADASTLGRRVRHVLPGQHDRPDVGRLDPRHETKQDGLAGAGWAEDANDLAALELERHGVKHDVVVKAFV